jgi:hypothetical protein
MNRVVVFFGSIGVFMPDLPLLDVQQCKNLSFFLYCINYNSYNSYKLKIF